MPPDIGYPRIMAVTTSRLYTLGWAVVFFALINIATLMTFGGEKTFMRFHFHPSYEEVTNAIALVHQETRPTVVFVGGSVQWGAGSRDPSATVPAEFARLAGSGVAVYNLAVVAGRPIDEYLLSYLLKDSADLIIADYNYEFHQPLSHERLISDRGTYVRMGQLYDTYGPDILKDIPAMRACLEDRDLPVPGQDNFVEAALRSLVERHVPVFTYKDRINDMLFGQHPLTMIERVPLLYKRQIESGSSLSVGFIANLFAPPEGIISEAPWQPGMPPVHPKLPSVVFESNDLQSCLGRAWTAYATSSVRQFVTYLLPNNSAMYPGMQKTEIHKNNVMHLRTVFNNVPFYNFDDGTMSGDFFTDSTHLTASGSAAFARRLFTVLQADGRLPTTD